MIFHSKMPFLSHKDRAAHNHFTCIYFNSALDQPESTIDGFENCAYPNKCYHYINATSGETIKGKYKSKWRSFTFDANFM